METFAERLQKFIEHEHLTVYQVNKAAGLSTGLLIKALNGNNNVSSNNIAAILLTYPELNADWLLTGRGEMLMPQQYTKPESKEQPLPQDIENSLYRTIIWHLLLQDSYAETMQELRECLALIKSISERSGELRDQLLRLQKLLETNYQFQPQDHGLYEMSLRIAAGEDGKYTPTVLKDHLNLKARLAHFLELDQEEA